MDTGNEATETKFNWSLYLMDDDSIGTITSVPLPLLAGCVGIYTAEDLTLLDEIKGYTPEPVFTGSDTDKTRQLIEYSKSIRVQFEIIKTK